MTGVDDTGVVGLADRLWRAEVDRAPIPPITALRPDLTVEDAYAIQTHNVRRRVAAGAVVRGRRLGRTSRARQHVLGVDEPDFGVLLDDMFVDEGEECRSSCSSSPASWPRWPSSWRPTSPGPGVTIADALTAVAGVLPAIEVVDSRIADWRVQVADTVADNASAGKVVLGGRITPVTGRRPPPARGAALPQRGADRQRGRAPQRSATPLAASPWLANKLGAIGRGPAPRRHRARRAVAPDRTGPPGRRLPGRVRPPGLGHGAVHRRERGMSAASGIRPSAARAPPAPMPAGSRDALIRAQIDRVPIPPFTRKKPFLRVETAYEAQALARRAPPAGRRAAHRHEAGPDQPGQARSALGIHEPVFGRLTSGMLLPPGAAAAARRAHPPTGRAGDRVPDRRADRGADDGRRRAGRDRGGLPRHRDRRLALLRAASGCPTPSPTTRAPRGSSWAPAAPPPDELVDLGVLGCVFRSRGERRHRGGRRGDGRTRRPRWSGWPRRWRPEARHRGRVRSCCPAASRPRWRCGPARS